MAEAVQYISQADLTAECPVTGEICPARERIVELYTERLSTEAQSSLPWTSGINPASDRIKMGVKLVEMTAQAQLRGCAGVTDEACPVRTAMDESQPRRTLVQAVRKILKRSEQQE